MRHGAMRYGIVRLFLHSVLAFATIILFIIVFNYHVAPSTFRLNQQYLAVHSEALNSSNTSTKTAERRPDSFYPWTDDSDRTTSSTKPPVYGLFVLLELEKNSYMTSDGAENERLMYQNFDFPNCQQVTNLFYR